MLNLSDLGEGWVNDLGRWYSYRFMYSFIYTASTNFDITDYICFWKIHWFSFFPKIWPCRKIGPGQLTVTICTSWVVLEYPVQHTKLLGYNYRAIGSGEEDFQMFLHGGHFGYVTWTVWTNFRSPMPRRLHVKFGFNRPSGFRGEDVWKKLATHTYIPTDDRGELTRGRDKPHRSISLHFVGQDILQNCIHFSAEKSLEFLEQNLISLFVLITRSSDKDERYRSPHSSISSVDQDILQNRIYFSAGKKKRKKKDNLEFLSSNFDFSIRSQGVPIKINETAYRNVLFYLWTQISLNVAYLFLQKNSRLFFVSKFWCLYSIKRMPDKDKQDLLPHRCLSFVNQDSPQNYIYFLRMFCQ